MSSSPKNSAKRPAVREVVPYLDGGSFRWTEHDYPSPVARWNYHPEVEIHLIRRGTGNYIIGDRVGTFGPGHVAIVSAGIPHDWMSELAPDECIVGRDAVIQFTPDWLERAIRAMPELGPVRSLIEPTSSGIIFTGDTAARAAEQIELTGQHSGPGRIAHLFTLLGLLSDAPTSDRTAIAHKLCAEDAGREGKSAVDAGLSYVMQNLGGQIRMADAARLAFMSEPSFSKYFKKASGMTFSNLVKQLRIASACRALKESDASISSVALAAGYTNLSNFNRQFLSEMEVTPRRYREQHSRDHRGRDGALTSLEMRAHRG
ncbi:AraC family transcriptional regulator [Subtercola boreus]|uniref:HTH araC/xylS-type domain-containing protein n=1 Tax=Subtercola boreus TaxID=120213 RepID=A0A3E0W7G0_9MICO|nr:AraC family transcriptional regulator [Subtercola boreus]RFA17555.1 hypothetical protein B7R23_17220 [Subtercola boreus]RFA17605.1 hypothetical protein B7R24_16935 [Subtercola boreus]RFA24196.1 hypothetical protein B7R25_17295 [Subtercola boreus]